jgi:hypothetical protein
MTPTSVRERFEAARRDGVDPEEVLTALTYVREDGRQR